MKRHALPLLATLLCVGPVAAQQAAAEVMVTVTSADTQAQGFALVLATQALQQKAKVRVLLCAAGGPLALKAREPEALKPRSPKEMLEGLIKGGAQVEVCALFLPNSSHTAADLLDGVAVAKPQEVAAHMLQSQVRLLAY